MEALETGSPPRSGI